MPRSPGLQLSEEGIKLANDAFKLTGLSQQKLADRIADKYECIFTRQVVGRFLKGESVSNQNFVWLCQELGLDEDEVASLLCEPTAETEEQPTPVASPVQQSNVPSRPPHFLSRDVELKAVKEKILAETVRLVGVWGMSGIGKSVLAAELGRDEEVRYAFPDGVFWLNIGKEPAITRQQLWLAEELGDSSPGFKDEQQGKERLSKLLVNQGCLLILDDVWQAQDAKIFVDALGSHCKMLITTQDAGLITALRAVEHRLEELQDLQARVLLANWAGQHPETLPSGAHDVQEECGNLPLALSLCGAMVYDGTPWSDLLEALREADLSFIEKEQFPYYLNPNVFKALKVSVDALGRTNPHWEKHYLELAVFQVDEAVPEATIQTLWQHTGGLRERHVRKLLTTLERKALLRVEGEAFHRHIKLHNLHHDYLRAIQGDLTHLHNQLLEAYRQQKCLTPFPV